MGNVADVVPEALLDVPDKSVFAGSSLSLPSSSSSTVAQHASSLGLLRSKFIYEANKQFRINSDK